MTVSTAHLPKAERNAIDQLILNAPRNEGGRVVVDHGALVIEPHLYGFFVHTCVVLGEVEPPLGVSRELWTILEAAFQGDASWVLFDRDEPPSSAWPTYDHS
ncbi:hypothetical protein [Sphingobium sp. 15-1]|uniref:DUF5983 family protein n=1 Tax=Sphingobium sp. 15-1 TaxID=2729616 RepID=UPI00159C1EC0|nr:hypothetical protein [Sphingobium sp. 15-1]